LRGGSFKDINFVVKITYAKSDNTYSEIDVSVKVITYHKKEEEAELKE
jgi:hypothetical protein